MGSNFKLEYISSSQYCPQLLKKIKIIYQHLLDYPFILVCPGQSCLCLFPWCNY